MMNKTTFVNIVEALEEFYNKTYPALDALGMMCEDAPILRYFDDITATVSADVDPENIGEFYLTYDSPILFEYLYTNTLKNVVKDAAELYDFIQTKYSELRVNATTEQASPQ